MYIGVSTSNLGRTNFAKNPEIAERDIKITIISNRDRVKNESLDFERGLEPKKFMGIGLTAVEKKIIEVTDWYQNLEEVLLVADIVKVIRDFRGFPIIIIKLRPEEFAVGQELYKGISPVDKTDLVETEEIAIHDAKIDIENYYIREKDKKILYP